MEEPRSFDESDRVLPTIAATLMAMLKTRFDLLQADLAEEHESLVAQLRLTVIGGAAGLLAAFTTILTLTVAVPEEYRPVVLGGVALMLAALSFWAFSLRARHRPRFARPFSSLLEQLGLDAKALLGRPEEDHRETP